LLIHGRWRQLYRFHAEKEPVWHVAAHMAEMLNCLGFMWRSGF
jgi:hypothetical protein